MGRALPAAAALVALTSTPVSAGPGEVLTHLKISDTQGGFDGVLDDSDQFGSSVAWLGGGRLAVGAPKDGDGGAERGAVWLLDTQGEATVNVVAKLSAAGTDAFDWFGFSVAAMGDIDGNGVADLAVGTPRDDDGGGNGQSSDTGAVWVLLLDGDGGITAEVKVSATSGGFAGRLDDVDRFGHEVAAVGDLDGNGVSELAVGAILDDDGGGNRGAVWVLFIESDGTVAGHTKISDTAGGFAGTLDDSDFFGRALAGLGDLDGDQVPDLAVGASGDDDGGSNRGAMWVLLLNADGTVRTHQKLSATAGGVTGPLDDGDAFGQTASVVDTTGGSGVDLVVGANGDGDGGPGRGAAWLLTLGVNGLVVAERKISDTAGCFTGTLADGDWFGWSVTGIGDRDGNGSDDLAVGAKLDDDGGPDRGAVWLLSLASSAACPWDVDGCGVGITDMLVLLGAWDTDPGGPPDFDGDGTVGIADFLELLANWGPCR